MRKWVVILLILCADIGSAQTLIIAQPARRRVPAAGGGLALVSSKLDSITGGGGVYTTTFTCSGSGRYFEGSIIGNNGGAGGLDWRVDSVFFDGNYSTGQRCTFVDSLFCTIGGATHGSVWGLIAPRTTTNATVTIYAHSNGTIYLFSNTQIFMYAFTGANQSTPIRNVAHQEQWYGNPTASLTSGATDIVTGFLFDYWSEGGTITPGGGETKVLGNGIKSIAVTKPGSAGTVSLTETMGNSGNITLFFATSVQP